jgi:hypothetical protein
MRIEVATALSSVAPGAQEQSVFVRGSHCADGEYCGRVPRFDPRRDKCLHQRVSSNRDERSVVNAGHYLPGLL